MEITNLTSHHAATNEQRRQQATHHNSFVKAMTSESIPQNEEVQLAGCSNDTKLSLCMMVENEEKSIEACLQSIISAVDEVIIVDIGSTDDTKAICRRLGALVINYDCKGDFAQARNEGLKLAKGEWILWLNADEIVEEQDHSNLRKALIGCKQEALAIHFIQFYGESDNVDESLEHPEVRLFKNHKGIFFEGKIHEHLNLTNIREIARIPVRVYQYGYMQDKMHQKQKSESTIRRLKKERVNLAYSPWIDYHIAREYLNQQRYERAFEEVNRSILRFLMFGTRPPALAYRLKYLILLSHGNMVGGLEGIDKAIQMYPDYVDLHFIKGLFLFSKGTFSEAENVFLNCIALGEDNESYLIMRGAGSFKSWFYVGQCRERKGQLEKAKEAYRTSLRICASYSPAYIALADLP